MSRTGFEPAPLGVSQRTSFILIVTLVTRFPTRQMGTSGSRSRATGSTTAIGGCNGASITSSIALPISKASSTAGVGLLVLAMPCALGLASIGSLICYCWYSYCHPRICWIWIKICGLHWLCLRNCNLVNWFFVLQLDKGLALVMLMVLMDLLLVF